MELVGGLAERAAHVDALGVALDMHGDRRVDLLVEPDLVQVDVDDAVAHGVELEVLNQRGPGAVTVDRHVEDRVDAVRRDGVAQRASVDRDGERLGARGVDHARDVSHGAHRLRVLRAAPLTRPHLQFHSLH